MQTLVSSVELMDIRHGTESASRSGITAWTSQTLKMRIQPKRTESKQREVSDEKLSESKRDRGKASKGENSGSVWAETEYHRAVRYMQVKSLRAVGGYTTLTLAFSLSQGLGE